MKRDVATSKLVKPKVADKDTSLSIVKAAAILRDIGSSSEGRTLMEVVASTPAELTALMQREIPRWADLVKKSGAQPN